MGVVITYFYSIMSGQVYEFLSDENKEKWQGLLHNALRKVIYYR